MSNVIKQPERKDNTYPWISFFIQIPEGRTDPINFEYINMQDKNDVMALYLYEYKNESDFEAGKNYIYRPFTYLDSLFSLSTLNIQ